jgi:hypothetical protein
MPKTRLASRASGMVSLPCYVAKATRLEEETSDCGVAVFEDGWQPARMQLVVPVRRA